MSDILQKWDTQRRSSERRRSARCQLLPPLEIEILQGDHSEPVQARLGDLSLGGCHVATDSVFPLETEVKITLKKGEDRVCAQARVVWAVPKMGLGLAFTSMEGENFRILESWLAMFVATTWVAANRRRAQRVHMEIKVSVSGYDGNGARFTEVTHTVVISAFGGLVVLRTPVKRGQKLVVSNLQTERTMECMVAHIEAQGTEWAVGLAFSVLNQPFWPVDFPPADWSSNHPDAKRFDL